MHFFSKKVLLLLLLFPFRVFATHIVGGEFELIHLEGYNYEVRLILYFDDYYGNPQAEDPWINAAIYKKENDQFIQTVSLTNQGSSFVPYTNIACTIEKLQTRKIIYRTNLYLSPDVFNDPEGYYLTWDRCCRNNVITNIQNPESAGQVFYLEFPPVIKDGKQFINSSPVLFPPLSDYGCINQFYYVDFRGTDKDGDSLVYSLVTPLAGNSSPENPAPSPPGQAPYPEVVWQEGIGTDNMVPGNPGLQISDAGLLTVTPSNEGLFVFSVKCEEFRNNQKIGEVRRDFQMLVIDCPEPGVPPDIKIKVKGQNAFYNSKDTIRFGANDAKCLEAYVTDDDGAEMITFTAIPVNFNQRIDTLFNDYIGEISNVDDTLVTDICLPDCPLIIGKVAIIDLVAMDDNCSLPLRDSIRLLIDIESIDNNQPVFVNQANTFIEAEINAGETYRLSLNGQDNDGDSLSMELIPVNFNMKDYGLSYVPVQNENGEIEYIFSFDGNCRVYDFNSQNNFEVQFVINDHNECNLNNTDTLTLNLRVNVPDNDPPLISTNLNDQEINVRINEVIQFLVEGIDINNDLVTIFAEGNGFSLDDYGMFFEEKSGFGKTVSQFTWRLTCDQVDLARKSSFEIRFLAEENNLCNTAEMDTATVIINVLPPRNRRPNVFSPDIFEYQTIEVQVGQTLNFNVAAIDNDGDSVYLRLANSNLYEKELNTSFSSAEGFTRAVSEFSWTPDCSALTEEMGPKLIDFKFYVTDNKCFNNRADTLTISVILKDIPGGYEEFLPDNVFSPNNDQINDYFFIDDLPKDNCQGEFRQIEIFNRWGEVVFTSNNREFQWDGGGKPPGVYYYVITYSAFRYKGTVTILF